MPRHIACLTFDFDAMSGMIAWGLTSPTPISRGEFGAIGVGRILALLAKYRIKATFFIPGVVIGTYRASFSARPYVGKDKPITGRLGYPVPPIPMVEAFGPLEL